MRIFSSRYKPSVGGLVLAIILIPIIVALRWDRVKRWYQPSRLTPEVMAGFGDIRFDLAAGTAMPYGVTRVHADSDHPEDFSGLRCVGYDGDGKPVQSLGVSTHAVPQMQESPRVFAAGTFIYKVFRSEERKRMVVVAMRKREPGYDPKHNDWSYLFGDSYQPYESGRIEKCIACHSKVAAEDYVFNLMKP